MKKNNLKLATLFISSLSLGMSIFPISHINAKIPSFLSLEATSNTQNGIANLGNGNASVTIKGNNNQTLIGKKFGLYKLFNVVNSEDLQSLNYTLNPQFAPALRYVVAHRLNKDEQTIAEYEIIDYIQTLNSNEIEGNNPTPILEGRYSEFRYFVEELRDTMKDMNLNPSVVTVNDVKPNNSFDIIGLDYGYYMIDEITSSQNTYQASSLCMVTTVNPNATMNIKSDYPAIIKKIQEDDINLLSNNAVKDANGWNDIADFEIGQTVPYKYESFVPNMSGYHTYYLAFHDIMDEALTFNKDTVKIQISNAAKTYTLANNEYVVTEFDGRDTFKIAIKNLKAIVDREWSLDLNNNKEAPYGQTITVTYNATLNDKAADDTGREGFENDVKLEFSNNPDSDGGGETGETPWDSVVCFTYKINGLKVNNHNVNLKGAKFRLYSDEKCTNEVFLKETSKGYNVINKDSLTEDSQTVEMISNDKGEFTIFGLDQGTYWLKETYAPDGYRQLLDPIEITITPTFTNDRDNYIKGDGATDKTLQNLEATAHIKQFLSGIFDDNVLHLDTDLNEGSANITVINTATSLLPITGSNATFIMIGAGCILMVGVISSKKRKSNMNA